MSVLVTSESGVFGPGAVSTNKTPMIPKVIEAPINTRVAIFCMFLVYQTKTHEYC